MGITFSSIHIYSAAPVDNKNFKFQCFSPGWQTYIPECEDFSDPEDSQRIAKKISKVVDSPVLWFYEFDEDFLLLKFFLDGKRFASYSGDGTGNNKNLYQIPSLVGYEQGNKHRLSKILNCSDIDFQVELLEEFFGVCLLPFPELLDENPGAFSRTRSDTLFKEYMKEEKVLTGKRAAIQAELVQEMEGLLDGSDWENEWFGRDQCYYLPYFKEHYYLYFKAKITGIERIPVCFRNGKIEFISREEMRRDGADKPYPCRDPGDHPMYEQDYQPSRLTFADTAPAEYAGKTLKLPRGLYGMGFDAKKRLVLHDSRGMFAIVDENMKIIAKQRLKGYILDIDGDYILTVKDRGIFGTIRVYHIYDK